MAHGKLGFLSLTSVDPSFSSCSQTPSSWRSLRNPHILLGEQQHVIVNTMQCYTKQSESIGLMHMNPSQHSKTSDITRGHTDKT
jgi:hypothetical protein